MHLFSSPTDQVSGGLMRGNAWPIEIDLFKVIASHRSSSTPSVPNCARESFESFYGCIEQKEGRKKNTPCTYTNTHTCALTHTHSYSKWVLDHSRSKRINSCQAKPSLIHLIHISPLCVSARGRSQRREKLLPLWGNMFQLQAGFVFSNMRIRQLGRRIAVCHREHIPNTWLCRRRLQTEG